MTVNAKHSPRGRQARHVSFTELCGWYFAYDACIHYFIYHAQYCVQSQALAAFVNIRLPFQMQSMNQHQFDSGHYAPQDWIPVDCTRLISLVPYIRRLVATGFDSPTVLCTFFGESWHAGVGHILDSERSNYLFATKSDNWLSVKSSYDMEAGQEIPFLAPLQVTEGDLCEADRKWSGWLAMQDWMIGPRAPDAGL